MLPGALDPESSQGTAGPEHTVGATSAHLASKEEPSRLLPSKQQQSLRTSSSQLENLTVKQIEKKENALVQGHEAQINTHICLFPESEFPL